MRTVSTVTIIVFLVGMASLVFVFQNIMKEYQFPETITRALQHINSKSKEAHFRTFVRRASDQKKFWKLLAVLTSAMDEAGITYYMNSGTLIGSHRHHGLIPWDDDADLAVSENNRTRLYRLLKSLRPHYVPITFCAKFLDPHCRAHWKLFHASDSDELPGYNYRWPFVDLFFFRQNSTHVWTDWAWPINETWPLDIVFPLRRRPFGRLMLPAPCDTAAALRASFGDPSACESSKTQYHTMTALKPVTVNCSTLYARFPFVRRREPFVAKKGKKFVTETLMVGDRTIREIKFEDGCTK